MDATRDVARQMAEEGIIELVQRGKVRPKSPLVPDALAYTRNELWLHEHNWTLNMYWTQPTPYT